MTIKKLQKQNDWILPLYKIYSDDEDEKLITKIIRRGSGWAIGPEIEEFENLISKYVGVDYCTCLNSGTSALHASYLAYGFGKNDELIVPSFSFISTANSVLFVNSKPKFADIEERTLGLDPNSVENCITKKTKAIVPMDYGGSSCDIFELRKIAKKHNLVLIEDAAESLGSSFKNKKVGSVADSAIFSFCGNKVLTTGEGGAVVTNSKKIFEKIKLIRSHGRLDKINYFNNTSNSNYVNLGYNWRMSSITASLGISQIQKLDKIIKLRRRNAQDLIKSFSKIPEIKVVNSLNSQENIFQLFSILLPSKTIRNALQKYLITKKIFSKVYFEPIHLTKFYKVKYKIKKGSLPVTEKISDRILTLPMYPNMTKGEKIYLIQSVSEFFESKH
jgi:perosamine synthetase